MNELDQLNKTMTNRIQALSNRVVELEENNTVLADKVNKIEGSILSHVFVSNLAFSDSRWILWQDWLQRYISMFLVFVKTQDVHSLLRDLEQIKIVDSSSIVFENVSLNTCNGYDGTTGKVKQILHRWDRIRILIWGQQS